MKWLVPAMALLAAAAWQPDRGFPPASAPQIQAGLLGSKHDFAPPDAPLIEHCVACHGRPTPPLQTASQPAATRPAFEALALTYARLDGRLHRSTALCLSCHDGTLAGFIAAEGFTVAVAPPAARVDWRHDHPVGVAYPRNGREYRPAGQVVRAGVLLPEGFVECVSCHDPHDTWGQPAMLAASNRRSALCLTCHVK